VGVPFSLVILLRIAGALVPAGLWGDFQGSSAMKARLTRIEAKRRLERVWLGANEMRVGRDPDSDLVIEGARGSRLHAMIRPLGDRHTVTDTGSTNGTTVNGVALARTPVLLENGDLIEFAGEFAYLYETGPTISTQRWLQAACVMVAVLLLSSAFAFWRLVLHQPILERATALAREGRDAGERGDLAVANTALSEAARLLIRNGYLDDVERSELIPAAMERLEHELGDDTDMVALFGRVQQARRERSDALIGELEADVDVEPAAPVQGDSPALEASSDTAPRTGTQDSETAGEGIPSPDS